jgi:hypothetical protein
MNPDTNAKLRTPLPTLRCAWAATVKNAGWDCGASQVARCDGHQRIIR